MFIIVISPSLRIEAIRVLHSADQVVTAMNERAKANVYWPGITNDIQGCRKTATVVTLLHQAVLAYL